MTSDNSMSIMKSLAFWRDGRWTPSLCNLSVYAAAVIARLKALAPYALIELVLPGGSVMALLLWLYRQRKNGAGFGPLATKLLALLRPDAARERLAASSQGRRRSDVGELDFQLGEGTGCAEAKASLHSGISTHSRRSHRKLKADGAAVLCLDGVAQ